MMEGVRWPPPLHFVSKCMLLEIAGGDPFDGRGWPTNPRPQDISPMNEGVSMATPSMARGGHRNPLVHWTNVQSLSACILIQNVKGVANEPLAIEGVANEPPAMEGAPTPQK